MIVNTMILLLFPLLMAFAASSDLLTMTISNKVSLLLLGGFCFLAIITGMAISDIGSHVGAGALVLAVAFFCFARGWIGGGDAKLAAATAVWLGFDQLLQYLLGASLLGAVLTLLILKFRGAHLPPIFSRFEWLDRLHQRDQGVPYGIALAAAALLVYPDTIWMKAIAA
jgi:prepilin peptidase CpaA